MVENSRSRPVISATSEAKVFGKDWSFDYVGGLFNGRGAEPTDVQNGSDLNSLKAPSVRLAFARGGPVDLEFGASYYADDIPPDPALPGRLDSMDEEILGAHLVLEGRRFDFFAEYFHMRHEDHASGARYRHPLYYALAMWTPRKWKPYAGYERVDHDESDPSFAGIEAERRTLLGVRFVPHPFVAVKAELRRAVTSGERTDGLAVQITYTF